MGDEQIRSDVCGYSPGVISEERCPVCHTRGQKVRKITAENLVKDEYKQLITEDHYYLCLATDCGVVYFNHAGDVYFSRD